MIKVESTVQHGAPYPLVVITGMGILSSVGTGIVNFDQALRTGQNTFAHSSHFSLPSFPVLVAALQDFNFDQVLNDFSDLSETIIARVRKAGHRAPLVIQSSLIAALEAWQHAKLDQRSIDNTRIGLVVAGHNTTQRYQYDLHSSFQEEPDYLSASYALHFMDTDQVGTISHALGIQGEGFIVGGASASGNMAIIHGYRLIQQRCVDVCVVVGVLADLSPLEIQGFHNIGALGGRNFQHEPERACRPFDRDHEGFIWGQASGCLILESDKLAKKAGISILGVIKGVATNLDGNRLSDPSLSGEIRVMQQALTNAQVTPDDISYINTHGSSSPLGDKTEIAAIRSVLGNVSSQVWLNSTKSIIGHCLWSAGIVEAIATLLQLQGSYVHSNRNLDNPIDNVCRFVGHKREDASLQVAMSNSFGFGGINSSVIFTRGEDHASRN